jgi:NAD(P) transhydrogenase subunit beta
MNIPDYVIQLAYLVAAVCFMSGLKMLSSPRTARRGNFVSMIGMIIAVGATAASGDILNWKLILAGVAVGGIVGALAATKIQMTAMPQMVAILNGFGGGASMLVAMAQYLKGFEGQEFVPQIAIVLAALIGGITLSGSLIAFLKLQEWMTGKPILLFGRHVFNLVLLLGCVAIAVILLAPGPSASLFQHLSPTSFFLIYCGISLLLGILLVIAIGGADMPVVISLLNSYSGIAVAITGFVLESNILIIVGSLVGASGIILTKIMCKAMNRSLANVIFGGFGAVVETSSGDGPQGTVKEASVDEAAMVLADAQSVIFIPGYGMAVAQAQHAVRDLAGLLQNQGATVKYAIHPVAGRMPGHMNVLLAEANVPYDLLFDLDQINGEFSQTDVVVVVGANDVVNPAAKTDKSSPIYGMPVFNVEEARSCMVLKRSLNVGFAGIQNQLFFEDNTMMVFGDAKKTLTGMASAMKEL